MLVVCSLHILNNTAIGVESSIVKYGLYTKKQDTGRLITHVCLLYKHVVVVR